MGCLTGAELGDFSAKDSTHSPEISPHMEQVTSVPRIVHQALPWMCVRHRSGTQVTPWEFSPPFLSLFLLTECCVNSISINRALHDGVLLCQQLPGLNVHQAVIILILICCKRDLYPSEAIWMILAYIRI